MLPIIDDFDRALAEITKSGDDNLLKGVELIYNKLMATLKSKGLEKVEVASGDAFDSELHEAITQIPAPSEDLKGKTIGVYSLASGTRENLLILLHEAGLTEDDVTIVETGLLNFAPLMQGQVDATAATDTGLHIGKQKGLDDYKVFEVKDYLNFSSDLFVVTREYYEENEALLKDFLRAYRSSAEWMMENPQEAAQLAKTYAIDGQDVEQNEAIIDIRNRSSQQSKAEHPLGYIDLEEMQHAIDVYEQLGLIENKIEIEQYVTNDLLP